LDDKLELAQTAILVHDYATAASALAGIDEAGRNTAPYYNVAGEVALTQNKPAEAEADFAQCVRLDPSNYAPQLSLAVLELHSSNALDMAEARISLRRIGMNSTNIPIRLQAERELVLDALKYRDENTALSFSSDLMQQANASFQDKLLRLEVLKFTDSDQYRPILASSEREATNSPDGVYQMSLWLMDHNDSGQALAWLQSLPPYIQTNQPAALVIAQCEMLAQNWVGLQKSVARENWGPLEFTRLAYLARAQREQGFYESSKAQWDVALRAANGQKGNLIALYRLTYQWNWQAEGQDILSSIVNTFPEEQWAVPQLAKMLYTSGSTRPLMELFSTQLNRNPDDLDAKNNLAITAMLLHAQEMNPYTLASEVYEKAPTNYSYACTYAYSLYLQGKKADALKIMQSIPPQGLNDNTTAGYYGLILKSVGNNAQANVYLQRSIRGPLFPEERAMFQQAMSGL
jgi:predicted Zn-dependent protease